MLFDFFKSKSDVPKIRDLVWLNDAAKQDGCLKLLEESPHSIVAGWFNDTISSFQQFLQNQNTDIVVRNIRQLLSAQVENKRVIVLEHYPLSGKEVQLWQNWHAKEIYVLNSLTEPLFGYFGGENITALLQKMGMAENESIEHPMVSKALKNAQQKLDKNVVTDHSASSSQEWFRRNIPAKQ